MPIYIFFLTHIFLVFSCFPNIIIYILNITSIIKKIAVNEFRDFFFGNHYYKWIRFSKRNNYHSLKYLEKNLQFFVTKLTGNLPDPSTNKEYYNSYLKRKNKKAVKQSKIITQQLKPIINLYTVDIKPVIIEHAKTSHKLSKSIRQADFASKLGKYF